MSFSCNSKDFKSSIPISVIYFSDILLIWLNNRRLRCCLRVPASAAMNFASFLALGKWVWGDIGMHLENKSKNMFPLLSTSNRTTTTTK